MARRGRYSVRSQIVIDNEIVNPCNSLGNFISYEKEVDIDNKFNTYLYITGIINNAFRPQKPSNKTRIELHSTLILPDLLCGGENWTIKTSEARTAAAEMLLYVCVCARVCV
jgi:hypothetical protein